MQYTVQSSNAVKCTQSPEAGVFTPNLKEEEQRGVRRGGAKEEQRKRRSLFAPYYRVTGSRWLGTVQNIFGLIGSLNGGSVYI